MQLRFFASALCSAIVLASAPVSAAVLQASAPVAAVSATPAPAAPVTAPVAATVQSASGKDATRLAKSCSDPWWTMSGIQALTCLYIAAR